MRKLKQKHPLLLFSILGLTTIFGLFYSCRKPQRENDPVSTTNTETILYERSANSKKQSSLVAWKNIKLDDRLSKTTLIDYETDLSEDLENNTSWQDFLREKHLIINKKIIKKSFIDGTSIVLYSIPFNNASKNGYVNLYKLNNKQFWTLTTIEKLSNGITNYSITSKSGKLIMELQLDHTMKILKHSFAKNDELITDYSSLQNVNKRLLVSAEAVGSEEADCFQPGVSYYNCLQCIIIEHCGSDLACAITCGAFIEVCLGISVLACLP